VNMTVDAMRSPDEIRELAKAWFERQLERARAKQGQAWALHEDWVREYLATALRQRLIERGWRVGA
jgi:hypothetical protein